MSKTDIPNRLREKITEMERKLGMLEEEITDCCGLTLAQCHAVVELGRAGGVPLSNLAKSLDLDNSTVSRTVNNLVKKELAGRAEDAEDRRYISISLTGEGQGVYKTIESSMDRFYKGIVSRIPEDKQEQVIDSLQILLEAIGSEKCCE